MNAYIFLHSVLFATNLLIFLQLNSYSKYRSSDEPTSLIMELILRVINTH